MCTKTFHLTGVFARITRHGAYKGSHCTAHANVGFLADVSMFSNAASESGQYRFMLHNIMFFCEYLGHLIPC